MTRPKVGDLILITKCVWASDLINAMIQIPEGTICICLIISDDHLDRFLTTNGVFCIWNDFHMELLCFT